jgi:hypothetical protein
MTIWLLREELTGMKSEKKWEYPTFLQQSFDR